MADRREPVTAGDLREVTRTCAAALRRGASGDWSRPAGALAWDCRQTLEHAADCVLSYVVQLGSQAPDHYVAFMSGAADGADNDELVGFFAAAGLTLAAVVDGTPSSARAYHPSGMADPEGFAAMGAVEALVHTHDVVSGLHAQGVGVTLSPPSDLCARLVARLFPDAAPHADGWRLLLWATGRIDLSGREHVAGWRWHGAPLD